MHTESTIHQAYCVHYVTMWLPFPDLHSGTGCAVLGEEHLMNKA